MSAATGPPESDRRTGTPHQYQQQELTTRTLATEAETIGASQSQQQKGKPQQHMKPEILEMPTTVPASAVTPTAQCGGTQLRSFLGNLQKSHKNCENS
jgi:hypothetical protein